VQRYEKVVSCVGLMVKWGKVEKRRKKYNKKQKLFIIEGPDVRLRDAKD
jgi:hypothetical protein